MALPFSINFEDELLDYMRTVGHFIAVCKVIKDNIDVITTEHLNSDFFDAAVEIKKKRNLLNATSNGIAYYNNKLSALGWVGNIQTEVVAVDTVWNSLAAWYTTNEDKLLNTRTITNLEIVSPLVSSDVTAKNALIVILDNFIALE